MVHEEVAHDAVGGDVLDEADAKTQPVLVEIPEQFGPDRIEYDFCPETPAVEGEELEAEGAGLDDLGDDGEGRDEASEPRPECGQDVEAAGLFLLLVVQAGPQVGQVRRDERAEAGQRLPRRHRGGGSMLFLHGEIFKVGWWQAKWQYKFTQIKFLDELDVSQSVNCS